MGADGLRSDNAANQMIRFTSRMAHGSGPGGGPSILRVVRQFRRSRHSPQISRPILIQSVLLNLYGRYWLDRFPVCPAHAVSARAARS